MKAAALLVLIDCAFAVIDVPYKEKCVRVCGLLYSHLVSIKWIKCTYIFLEIFTAYSLIPDSGSAKPSHWTPTVDLDDENTTSS